MKYNVSGGNSMLLQFNFENHKSYLHETTLDLKATSYKEHKSNLITYKKDEEYLEVAAIYGANESGKSNILDAFKTMQNWVKNSFSAAEQVSEIPLKPFAFMKNNRKALYEVFFATGDSEYQYGFEATKKHVTKEWLMKRDFRYKQKYTLIFERLGQTINTSQSLDSAKKLLKSINEKTLALTLLSNLEFDDIKKAFNWVVSTYVIDFGDAFSNFNLDRILPDIAHGDSRYREGLKKYLNSIGSSVNDLFLEKIVGQSATNEKNVIYKAYSKHLVLPEKDEYLIPLHEESSGTRKMITIFTFLTDALNNGKTLMVDELDAKLHPLLMRYIINLFHNEKTNPKGAQLIFTTHDTNALSNELFRRDQIWFAEKDENGVSELFSLADFKINEAKVRNDATYNKDYLGGRYGAIPHLKDFMVNDNE